MTGETGPERGGSPGVSGSHGGSAGGGSEGLYRRAWEAGRSFEAFLASVTKHREFWLGMAETARVPDEAVQRARAAPGRWRLLGIGDDWCGDAANVMPVVAALAEAAGVELRIVGREEHRGLMERHLTGRSRSIPVFVLLDGEGRPRGWWGPRPRELQARFEAELRALPAPERYRELRRWYARDRGAAIAREIADLLECGASGEEPAYRGTRPCPGLDGTAATGG